MKTPEKDFHASQKVRPNLKTWIRQFNRPPILLLFPKFCTIGQRVPYRTGKKIVLLFIRSRGSFMLDYIYIYFIVKYFVCIYDIKYPLDELWIKGWDNTFKECK